MDKAKNQYYIFQIKIHNMKANIKIICFLFLIDISAYSQQLPYQLNFSNLEIFHHPATTGLSNKIRIGGIHQKLFNGYKNSPTLIAAFGDMRLKETNSSFGAILMQDKLGIVNTHLIQFSYSYRLPEIFRSEDLFSIGIQSGITRYSFSFEELKPYHKDDISLTAVSNQSKIKPTLGVGIYYRQFDFKEDPEQYGLVFYTSMNQFAGNNLSLSDSKFVANRIWHLSSGIEYHFGLEDFEFLPALLFDYRPGSSILQIGLKSVYKQFLFADIFYLTNQSFLINGGIEIAPSSNLENTLKLGMQLGLNSFNSVLDKKLSYGIYLQYLIN